MSRALVSRQTAVVSFRGLLGLLLGVILSGGLVDAQETSSNALTLESGQPIGRGTSLLSNSFSFSVTLDVPAHDSAGLNSGVSIGYLRRSIASVGHLADPEAVNHKFVLFRRPVQPGLTSLTWGNLQAGYGRIFMDDSVISRGTNGTVWEEPGCLYLKTRFRF